MAYTDIKDSLLAALVRRYGLYAAIRMCRNMHISFEDVYFRCFGRLPRLTS